MNPKDHSLLIGLCTKNCGAFLPRVLKNAETYASLFKDAKVFIVDGHSTDITEVLCKSWCKSDPQNRTWCKQPSANLPRGESLKEARNMVLNLTKPFWSEKTLLLLLDADSPNALKLDVDGFLTCFARDDWDALFPNQRLEYYDIWALRDDQLNDDYQLKFHGKSWNGEMQAALKPYQQSKKPTDGTFYKVYSAFGGAGLYKTSSIGEAQYECLIFDPRWNGMVPVCEHVPLHATMLKHGKKLWINCSWYIGEHV
jgi:hypothetical protein